MTCQEVRFIPVRFKDAYGPVGRVVPPVQVDGDECSRMRELHADRRPELEKWKPLTAAVKPVPANLRNH